jgi:dipeptidyl-peptidase 4
VLILYDAFDVYIWAKKLRMILSIRILPIVFFIFSNVLIAQPAKDLTLQEIWASPAFRNKSVQGIRSMRDGNHYSTLEYAEEGVKILKHPYLDPAKTETLFSAASIDLPGGKKLVFDSYEFSTDESRLLLPTEFEPVYRHSGKSAYVVIDLKTMKADYLSKGKQLLAEFSPDGKKVAFVRDNNLFIKDLELNIEKAVTTDGEQNKVINGSTDWVYEEEFSFTTAFFWSPDSKRLAWFKFDERAVKEYAMPTYGTLYPGNYTFKYPKAGETNSTVTAWIFNLIDQKTTQVNTGNDANQYLARGKWTYSGDAFCITRLNRHQNHLELLLADPENGAVRLLMEEQNNTYIDVHNNLTFLKDGKHFIWTSEVGGYNQIYLYGMNGKKLRPLTQKNADITQFYGVDESKGLVYYQMAFPSPWDRTLHVAKLSGKGSSALVERNGHQQAEFSSNYNYFILSHSNANEPPVFELCSGNGKKLKSLEENEALRQRLGEYRLGKREFFNFKPDYGSSSTSQPTWNLNGWMIKPPDFDPNKKYPVFMTVYGGPGHNTVENSWGGANRLWYDLLAQRGYIVVSVDNRGTGNRGEEFKKCTYLQLGKLETEDQMAAARYLASLPYVDGSRIGIQGWSYGGYMSSLCITKGAELFKMAIAVAPVTNWRYYDSIYTERFMKTPEENASGYDDNSPINHATRLKGKYLLIHGTADDNVHFQNAVEMTSALVKANKQFDLFFYPDKNHGIYGGNTRLHLYSMMTDYILKNL